MKKEKMTFNVTPEIKNEIKNYVENLGYNLNADVPTSIGGGGHFRISVGL